jgi:hypothetical protein
MEVLNWKVEPELVAKNMQTGEPCIKASSPCPCGCSPKPFVYISNGEIGLTVRFEDEEELKKFKQQVACMEMTVWRCRFCKHLVDLQEEGEEYVGGCEYGLTSETCGDKYELADCYQDYDPLEHRN